MSQTDAVALSALGAFFAAGLKPRPSGARHNIFSAASWVCHFEGSGWSHVYGKVTHYLERTQE